MSLTLFYLHVNGYFHGNLKPENIEVDKNLSKFYIKNYFFEEKLVKNQIETNYNILSNFIFFNKY